LKDRSFAPEYQEEGTATMSAETQIKISNSPTGRIVLHLLALTRDRHYRWHLAGIARELSHRRIFPTPTPSP
jgi:hypothetical protein